MARLFNILQQIENLENGNERKNLYRELDVIEHKLRKIDANIASMIRRKDSYYTNKDYILDDVNNIREIVMFGSDEKGCEYVFSRSAQFLFDLLQKEFQLAPNLVLKTNISCNAYYEGNCNYVFDSKECNEKYQKIFPNSERVILLRYGMLTNHKLLEYQEHTTNIKYAAIIVNGSEQKENDMFHVKFAERDMFEKLTESKQGILYTFRDYKYFDSNLISDSFIENVLLTPYDCLIISGPTVSI